MLRMFGCMPHEILHHHNATCLFAKNRIQVISSKKKIFEIFERELHPILRIILGPFHWKAGVADGVFAHPDMGLVDNYWPLNSEGTQKVTSEWIIQQKEARCPSAHVSGVLGCQARSLAGLMAQLRAELTVFWWLLVFSPSDAYLTSLCVSARWSIFV